MVVVGGAELQWSVCLRWSICVWLAMLGCSDVGSDAEKNDIGGVGLLLAEIMG